MKPLILAMVLLATPASVPATAQSLGIGSETGAPLPRFASLKFNKVNLRRGAGEDYPIAWTFQLYGLPVEIFQEFRDWRHVRDHDGTTGWMHKSQLGSARTALIREEIADLRAEPDGTTKVVARVEPGVVLRLIECQLDWCRAKVEGYRGWVSKAGLWGVVPEDVFGQD
jgi:SH3-like domain-containing protein